MPDFPDFTIPKWDRRDWAGKEIAYKTWAINPGNFYKPGEDAAYKIYEVPAGKRLFYASSNINLKFRGNAYFYVYGGFSFHQALLEPYETSINVSSIPLPIEQGEKIYIWVINEDIIGGYARYVFTGWEEAASTPEKPRNDDPEELYRTGEFNFCQIISLPNNEQVFIFGKAKKKVRHFLKVKNYGLKSQKKLASFHLKSDEAAEILDISDTKPEKVKEVLERYEKKYKKRKFV